MKMYQYETHLHTSESSACSLVSGTEQARRYKEAGYDGIIVTDHFFNGNSTVPADLCWEERIDRFCLGYEHAKAEGDKIGLSVFFGWESNYSATEFLIYGLDKQWLKAHPDMLSWSIEEQYKKVHEAGGFVVHAHPFRKRFYIKEVRLFPFYIDAVEAYNVGNKNDEFDEKAFQYAKKHNLPVTAGTDSHGYEEIRSGVAFTRKLLEIKDYIDGIKSNSGYELINSKRVK